MPQEHNIVTSSDINLLGGFKLENQMYSIAIDNDSIVIKDGVLTAKVKLVLATESEMDIGGEANKDKAVSAQYYQKEIRVTNSFTQLGLLAGDLSRGVKCTNIGYLSGASSLGNYQTSIGLQAGQGNRGNNQTALGTNAGYGNMKNFQSVFGDNAGYGNTGEFQTAFGANAGFTNSGTYQIAFGYNAGFKNKANNSIFIGRCLDDLSKKTNSSQNNINIIGNDVSIRENEDNYFILGSNQTKHIYSSGAFHGKAFRETSDSRCKIVGDKIRTLNNGIEIYEYTYLDNGLESLGWVAQQVEQLLKDNGYSDKIIDRVIPKVRDVNWEETIKQFNKRFKSDIKLWIEADSILLEAQNNVFKKYKLDVTPIDEFFLNVENQFINFSTETTKEKLSKREKSILKAYNELLELSTLNNFLVYSNDIRTINRTAVLDLLNM